MIRILHRPNGNMDIGGRETFIMSIYRNIDRTKVQFDFVVNTESKSDYYDEIVALGGSIICIPKHKGIIGRLKNMVEWERFLKKNANNYEAIHMHTASLLSIIPLVKSKKYGIKKRVIHSSSSNLLKTNILNYIIKIIIHNVNKQLIDKYATHFFSCSNEAGVWLYNRRIIKNQKARIINNGIEASKFVYNKEIRCSVRKDLGLNNKFVIGHVGRFHPVKNHNYLIDIFSEIYNKDKTAYLLLIGDGEEKINVMNKVKNKGLSNVVKFLGKRDDIDRLMQSIDVFIFPSHFEGLGRVLIEAQASGLKIFASSSITTETQITSLIEYINLGQSPNYWADRVMEIKGYSRESNICKIIESGYDIKSVAKQLEELYLS